LLNNIRKTGSSKLACFLIGGEMKEKYNQDNSSSQEKEPDPFSDASQIARRVILLAMDWESLSDDERLEAMPGLGYN
jgi:hypothetical protein